jgi:hypothetical protein
MKGRRLFWSVPIAVPPPLDLARHRIAPLAPALVAGDELADQVTENDRAITRHGIG